MQTDDDFYLDALVGLLVGVLLGVITSVFIINVVDVGKTSGTR